MKWILADKGFTLLEIMVVLSIAAIALISIFDLQAQTVSMNMAAKFNATAPFLAQEKLAELEMLPAGDTPGDSGDFGEKYPGFEWEITVEDIRTDLFKSEEMGLKKIEVLIGFNNEELEYRLRVYRLSQD